MIASRRGFLAGITSFVCAPAIVRAESLMKLHQIPERFATVWGVGHDLEVIEHVVWTPKDAFLFARHNALDKFREVTDVVYTHPLPEPLVWSNHWTERHKMRDQDIPANAIASCDYGAYVANNRRDGSPVVQENGFTRIMGYGEMRDWQASQRPELGGPKDDRWIDEQVKLNIANDQWSHQDVPWKPNQKLTLELDLNKPIKTRVQTKMGQITGMDMTNV
jgi:hypothetical protein